MRLPLAILLVTGCAVTPMRPAGPPQTGIEARFGCQILTTRALDRMQREHAALGQAGARLSRHELARRWLRGRRVLRLMNQPLIEVINAAGESVGRWSDAEVHDAIARAQGALDGYSRAEVESVLDERLVGEQLGAQTLAIALASEEGFRRIEAQVRSQRPAHLSASEWGCEEAVE